MILVALGRLPPDMVEVEGGCTSSKWSFEKEAA